MRQLATAFCAMIGATLAAPASAALPGPVRVEQGLVSGAPAAGASVTVFRGIPYAAPPVGPLRWQPPRPAAKWPGVRRAETWGPICPQPANGATRDRTMDEDCLNLNVWTAAAKPGERRPVMVWFHGGGATGAGSEPLFDGAVLARKGVVVVTVEYRIGALGGLALPELSRESGHHASGNYGLMDDIAALRWVRKNIAAFGGDPGNVTLFGQSYGAGTQHFLAMSPLAKGLFRRMITQSHARYPRDPVLMQVATSYTSLAEGEADGTRLAERLGAPTLAALRRLPWQKFVETPGGGGGNHVIDGWVVPRTYADTYAAGTQADVLVIAGNNQDETGAAPETAYERIAARPPGRGPNNVPQAFARLADYQAFARARFGAMADEFLKLYPAATDREAFSANNAQVRDNARVSLWMWAGAWRKAATKPVYLYYWTRAQPGPGHDTAGAYHGAEIAYAFGDLYPPTLPWTDEDRRIADVTSSYWANFARTGDPNGPGLPRWAAFDGTSEQVMELGDHFAPIPLADPAKVDFWKRFYATQPAR